MSGLCAWLRTNDSSPALGPIMRPQLDTASPFDSTQSARLVRYLAGQEDDARPRSSPAGRAIRSVISTLLLGLLLSWATVAQAQNLVQNGTFNTDVIGWTAGTGSISHDSGDGSASGPGSLSMTRGSGTTSARHCVSGVMGGATYDFGADFRIVSGGSLNFCRVQLLEHASSNCTGAPISQMGLVQQLSPTDSAIYTELASSHTVEATTASVRIRLDCDKNPGSPHRVNWDDVFLMPPPLPTTRYTIVAGHPGALYQLPGDNGQIGDGDDVPSADPIVTFGSDPNYRGSFSYVGATVPSNRGGQTLFGISKRDTPGLPDDQNIVYFLEGTFDYNPTDGIVRSNIRGTGAQQGVGEVLIPEFGSSELEEFFAPFPPTGDPYIDAILTQYAFRAEFLSFVYGSGDVSEDLPFPGLLSKSSQARIFAGSRGGGRGTPIGEGLTPKGATNADLSVSKSADVSGPLMPNALVTYTVSVDNAGPADADGVILKDRIADPLEYISNDCGAPPPVDRLFSWNLGLLPDGAVASCQISVRITATANFDIANAAIAFAETPDPNLDNNISDITVEVSAAQMPGVDQQPDRITGFPSDLDCDACPNGAQGLADSFKVDSPARICGLSYYGGYNDNTPFADQFRVEIYDDLRLTPGVPGVPGQLVATLSGSGLQTRMATGAQIAGAFDEYRYDVSIPVGQGPLLPRGRYWLLIINDSAAAGGNGDWFWESGAADLMGRTQPGNAFSIAIAETTVGWGPNPALANAFELCLTPFVDAIHDDGFEDTVVTRR